MRWLLVLVVFSDSDPALPDIQVIGSFASEEVCRNAGEEMYEVLKHEELRYPAFMCLDRGDGEERSEDGSTSLPLP